eukprot:GHVR01000459.1.p3 GENE.GHVR01000459.1~~GHVR01000459.1.p3  ORF type:complete len:113 (-),score=3.06 GHVR01000459.1:1624-1962(-)
MSSLSFDPFGKYILVLLRNNNLIIYNANSLLKIKQINLSPCLKDSLSIKENIIMSWSPDFNEFAIPSLNDKICPIAVNLSRKDHFSVKNIYLGHCSTIICCKFNPKLFNWEK